MENFFYKDVDKRYRQDMIEFLEYHPKYKSSGVNTYLGTYFSNNVRITCLGLPPDIRDVAYNLLMNDYPQRAVWDSHMYGWLGSFIHKFPNYRVVFMGRSGGQLILRGDPDSGYAFASNVFSYMSLYELRKFTGIVQEFDRLCDILRMDLIQFCKQRPPLVTRLT